MLKIMLATFVLASVSLSAFGACPSHVDSIKAFAGFNLPAGDCTNSLYHSNGQQAFYPSSGSWYAANGTQVYYPSSGSIYYSTGTQAYYPSSGSWYHSNGTQAYYPSSESWYHANGSQAFYPSSGGLYYANATKAGNVPSVNEMDMLKFVEIVH